MNASLDKLHDFYQPPPPSWAPQTIGWYIIFALVGIFLLWMIVHRVRRWLADRYRRDALRELPRLAPDQLSALLKRTALAAWPRENVASLSGEPWLKFLNESAGQALFQSAPGNRLEEIALHPVDLSVQNEMELRRLAAEWIRRHRVQA
jgi:hypothetical protein